MEPGTLVRCEMTKWGDRPHWSFDAVHLGSDEHGEWVGVPRGTRHTRPGHEFHSSVDSITLVPRDAWHLPTFQAPGIWCDLYIDIATPATWDDHVLRAVDLDLDVIRMSDPPPAGIDGTPEAEHPAGEIWIDDEDEFAEHQVAYGYPADVIAAAQSSCDAVFAAVSAGVAPYDGSAGAWFDRLAELTRDRSA